MMETSIILSKVRNKPENTLFAIKTKSSHYQLYSFNVLQV